MNHLKTIKETIEELYGLSLDEKTRKRPNVEARGFFVKIAKDSLNVTYDQIGKFINKDHATAIHSKKTIENLLTYDSKIQLVYQTLLDSLNLEPIDLENFTVFELKRLVKNLIRENKLLKLQLKK